MSNFFEITYTFGRARTGVIHTPHGSFETPAFIPVATRGVPPGSSLSDLRNIGYNYIMCNTYHLMEREDEIRRRGGLHAYLNWEGVIFTDSGGFQVFSLGAGSEFGIGKIGSIFTGSEIKRGKNYVNILDDGVEFLDPKTGKKTILTPEYSIYLQQLYGSDIMFAFDECTSPTHDYKYTLDALERTHRWAKRCLCAKTKNALFGIVQGGVYKDLREKSANYLSRLPFDGYAIGGSLGKSKNDMYRILDWVLPLLPQNKPRHLLGIGRLDDIFEAVERGVDTFDCVEPTRLARHGSLLVSPKSGGSVKNGFRWNISKSKGNDARVDEDCTCPLCQSYTRKYVYEMFKDKDSQYLRLAAIHNLTFMYNFMRAIRESIMIGRFSELKGYWLCSV
ncbi:MAG: tRNA guanosine(34) transglycosylase Tgt [Candidatus Aenigmatarchaeota archaeon]